MSAPLETPANPRAFLPAGVRESVLALVRAGGRPFTVQVAGYSMSPLLRPGDFVRVLPSGSESLRPGDVALFRAGGCLVVHRVIGRERRHPFRLLQKGDGAACWSWVHPCEVVGRVDRVERAGGRGGTALRGSRSWRIRAGCMAWRVCIAAAGRRGGRAGGPHRLWPTALNRLFFGLGRR